MKRSQQIVSFLPSATEMACALGLSDQIVGITHECDYPAEIRSKPVVVRNAVPMEEMSQPEIDAAVARRIGEGLSLYQVDEALLCELAPDLILTQDLCKVCAPSGNEVSEAIKLLPKKPEILWLTPKSLHEIAANVRDLGEATGRRPEAELLIRDACARLEAVASVTRDLPQRPRVFCMEWLDPIFCGGHWLPEMVKLAGGIDEIAQEGADSIRVEWREVLKWQPEVMVITPCGYNLPKVIEESRRLQSYPHWFDLPAVRRGQVYAVDANSYFARPGPRVVDGTELLAHLIHPDLFGWNGSALAYKRLEF